jgi:GT2 family glycosyltransferase
MLGTYFPQDRTMTVPWVSGACHLIPMSVWKRVGFLTEETFCGSDDYDYCYRVRQLGYEVWLCSESCMMHHCSVAVRDRWTAWEVEQVATHNFYVVLETHWPQWRVKTYMAVEVVCWKLEMLRQRLLPRTLNGLSPQEYRERLTLRLRMLLDLLWGRVRPLRRCQPTGRLTAAALPQ